MLIDFTGKTAIVTGGAGGIGRSVVKVLLQSNAKVAIFGRSRTSLDEAVAELSAFGTVKGYAVDISDTDTIAPAVKSVREEMGEVSILIQCAGQMGGNAGLNITPDEWDRAMNINTRGLFFVMQQVVLQSMKDLGGGAIVNLSSMAGIRGMHFPMCCQWYAASKGAVVAIGKQAAVEWANLGVRCNTICPGGVATPAMQGREMPPEIIDPIPMKRLCDPEEIANAAAFLVSDLCCTLTGQTIVIDGGASVVGY